MSDSKESAPASHRAHPSGRSRIINSIIGIVIVFVIAILVNYIFGMFNPRADLTENKVFTLSEGTKAILKRVDTPVTVRFYAVKDREYVGSYYETMARNVENLLAEYERNGNGKISVKRFDPEPDTDAEDNAVFDGLQQGMSQQTGNPMYFGISVEVLDRKETIPFIPNRPESLLEYDISRAILRAHDGASEKIRIMTSMQIGGGFSGNMQAPMQPGWFLVEDLRRDYDVEFLPATVAEIPADTDVLVLLHPYDVGDEAQFAVDQYLLKGGKVIAAVDPNFFASRFMSPPSQNPMMPPQGPQGPPPSSNLDKLFAAWGVKYVDNRVLADTVFQTQIATGYSPTILSLPQEAMNADDPVTMRLSDVFMVMPGAFELEEKAGISHEVLISSSPSNELVSGFDADPTQEDALARLRKNFNPSGTPKVLAARLSGSFTTAFPNGDPSQPAPAEDGDKSDDAPDDGDAPAEAEAEAASEKSDENAVEGDGCQDEPAADSEAAEESAKETDETKTEEVPTAPAAPPSLKKSEKDGIVLIFADADFLYDQFCTQPVQTLSGRREMRPNNDNLGLFQNALELALGGTDLINVRSRTSNRRAFTKLNEWQKRAEDKFQGDLNKFEEEVKEIETNINEILSTQPENIEQALVSPEIQGELAKLRESQAEMNKKVRSLRKEMKRDFDLAQLMIKLLTTGLVPLLVAIFGVGLALTRKVRTAAR